jgi:CHAD domain-containing protein
LSEIVGLRLGPNAIGKIRKEGYLASLRESERTLKERLKRVLERPDEEAIHDARTAVRKLDAHIALLPRRLRKKRKAEEAMERLDRVMKKTNEVRDLDVVRGKVSRHSGEAKAWFLMSLRQRRDELAEKALKAVKEARDVSVADIGEEVAERELEKRLEKLVPRLAERIDAMLPLVVAGSQNLEELHRLRIDCKRLRYTLELSSEGSTALISKLKGLQDSLGSIRDCDVTISYVSASTSAVRDALLREQVRLREKEFRSFSESVLRPR